MTSMLRVFCLPSLSPSTSPTFHICASGFLFPHLHRTLVSASGARRVVTSVSSPPLSHLSLSFRLAPSRFVSVSRILACQRPRLRLYLRPPAAGDPALERRPLRFRFPPLSRAGPSLRNLVIVPALGIGRRAIAQGPASQGPHDGKK